VRKTEKTRAEVFWTPVKRRRNCAPLFDPGPIAPDGSEEPAMTRKVVL
jgi:hypothetical protein